MDIEIPVADRMTQSGSSLLSMIQNTKTPILDLFVRESVQNSLDAHKENAEFVRVDFITGHFDKEPFNNELDKITDALNKRYPNKEYPFLAIKDTNTVGLTGPISEDDVKNEKYGNLLKLVYQISKPQEQQGAGGSWGLGKTIYFRVGIGLVIYYSRFENEDGDSEERLAVTLVEDEKSEETLIPPKGNGPQRGIAWWGVLNGKNKTRPVYKPSEIAKILDCFNIPRFNENETGTLVIIPYIDEKKLCTVNLFGEIENSTKHQIPFWCNDLSEYLKIATERWYCPRLNNKDYLYGPYLQVFINGNKIKKSEMEPVFRIYHNLYRYVFNPNDIDLDDIKINSETIHIKKYLKTPYEAGILVFTQVNNEILNTAFRPNPVLYINKISDTEESNRPVVAYTRQPGMIVDYENIGEWVRDIPATPKDSFIFGLFVLNSKSLLQKQGCETTLEQYVRKSEKADHTEWGDHTLCDNFSAQIIHLIKCRCAASIRNCYSEKKDNLENKINNTLSLKLGRMLLPPTGFGKAASFKSKTVKNGKKNGGSGSRAKLSMYIDTDNVQYSSKEMIVPVNLISIKNYKTKEISINLGMELEDGNLTVFEWEKSMGLTSPFEIFSVDLLFLRVDEDNINEHILLNSIKSNNKNDKYEIDLLNTHSGKGAEIRIRFPEPKAIEIDLNISLKILGSEYKPMFSLKYDMEETK